MLYSQVVMLLCDWRVFLCLAFPQCWLCICGLQYRKCDIKVRSKVCKKVTSTDACTGDFTLLQMSWCERINVHCKSALASTCTLSVQGAFLLSLPDVQCSQLHPSYHYQMCSVASCIPPITTRCAVQPAAFLLSLPDVQCNQLHPSYLLPDSSVLVIYPAHVLFKTTASSCAWVCHTNIT